MLLVRQMVRPTGQADVLTLAENPSNQYTANGLCEDVDQETSAIAATHQSHSPTTMLHQLSHLHNHPSQASDSDAHLLERSHQCRGHETYTDCLAYRQKQDQRTRNLFHADRLQPLNHLFSFRESSKDWRNSHRHQAKRTSAQDEFCRATVQIALVARTRKQQHCRAESRATGRIGSYGLD